MVDVLKNLEVTVFTEPQTKSGLELCSAARVKA